MKIPALIAALLTMFLLFSCVTEAEDNTISGHVESGLRVLPVDAKTGTLNFTVYRGDYIVFAFENEGSYTFKIPALEIETVMPRPDTEKQYVKMKESGEFEFTLGDRSGTIRVLELTEPNYTEVTADEAAELIKNIDPIILDVRTPGEFEAARISGAQLLPVQILSDNLDSLDHLKNSDILLYCASGNRSTVAAKILLDAGFTQVYNLRYGIGDWVRNGKPVE